MNLPTKIESILGGLPYQVNDVGMSGSEVRIYDDYVLKIQPQTVETDNEFAMSRWCEEYAASKQCEEPATSRQHEDHAASKQCDKYAMTKQCDAQSMAQCSSIKIPKILAYEVKEGTAYTLMTKAQGVMLCDEYYLTHAKETIRIMAEALKNLWTIDVSDCPYTTSRLENRLKVARYNVENGLVDMDNVEAETFGPNGMFEGAEELILWLEENMPEEDLVMTHGDMCLPNVFADDGKFSSFIDLGKMGPADRWQDVAIAIRSLKHNFEGYYNGGKAYYDFKAEEFLEALGIEMDEAKFKYYILLDELF